MITWTIDVVGVSTVTGVVSVLGFKGAMKLHTQNIFVSATKIDENTATFLDSCF